MAIEAPGTQLSFSILDTKMTVRAMRDSGYKSTTHALAELIDNSIESNATAIEVFGVSRREPETGRLRLKELAVLDNGDGMAPVSLRGSLRYGHGTRQGRMGIGRFGLGLPNSSMSQARRVDVWSWQSGVTNAYHTYLSLNEVEGGASKIPLSTRKTIPQVFLEASQVPFGDSGTLVVWSDLDRVEWKRASTTFKHTEALIGRIYRRFLARQSERLHKDDPRTDEIGPMRTIMLIPIDDSDGNPAVEEDEIIRVRPNDPLYLMSGTSCPEDFGPGPMFSELESSPFTVVVKYQGEEHKVHVRASFAQKHARNPFADKAEWPKQHFGKDAGRAPWGKHAAHNVGVSLVRAHREIQLDASWISSDDPRERWWTIEVDFPTALDEMFGVTNNKQNTRTFQRLARFEWEREALPDEESRGDVRRRMEKEGDPRASLLELRRQIETARSVMRRRVREARIPRVKRHTDDEKQKADAKATAAIEQRVDDGYEGQSDMAGGLGSEEEHHDTQLKSLTEKHKFDQEDAEKQIDETIRTGSRVRWIQSEQDSPAFFDVEPLPNVLQVALNTCHPVYRHLYEVMHSDVEKLNEEEVRGLLMKVAAAFRVLIYSWARYEEEQGERPRRKVRNARLEWGKYAEEFFDEDDGSLPPADLV